MVDSAEQAWLWFYVVCMAAGALLFVAWSREPRGVPHYEYAIAIFIPIWSGLAYMAQALGQGIVEVNGHTVYVARYLDWLVTTPLLLASLAFTAMFYAERKHTSLVAILIGADVVMILSALFADLTEREAIRWLWYFIGWACLLIIIYIAWSALRRIAYSHGEELGRVYSRVATLLTVLWLCYPIVWALGPSGVELYGSVTNTALFVVLPIVSKVGFSMYDLSELRRLGSRRASTAVDHSPAVV